MLTWRAGASAVRRRPHHFIILCLASIFIWCVFDIINFNLGMKAWHYIGMSPDFYGRATGYFFAFATIVPGMVMSGQVLIELGLFNWAQTRAGGFRMPHLALWASLLIGALMLAWVLWTRNPVTNFVMWTSLAFFARPHQLLARPPQHVARLRARLVRPNTSRLRRRRYLRPAVGILELLGPRQMDLPPPVSGNNRTHQILRNAHRRLPGLHPLRYRVLGHVATNKNPLRRAGGTAPRSAATALINA